MSDLCVRISPYPLNWNDAEAQCQEEGGHLLHITSQQVQSGIQELILKKKNLKDFFEDDKWKTGLSSSNDKYWIGGTVSLKMTFYKEIFFILHLGFERK